MVITGQRETLKLFFDLGNGNRILKELSSIGHINVKPAPKAHPDVKVTSKGYTENDVT